MNKYIFIGAFVASLVLVQSSRAEENSAYTLSDMVQKALENSPSLKASNADAQISEGEYTQAKAYENPELTIDAENFSGNKQLSGYGSAETTIGISQKIIPPSKYSARVKVAEHGIKASKTFNDIAQFELIKNVKIAYANAVAAEQNYKIATDKNSLSKIMLVDVKKRVNAAAAPLYQQSKSEVILATTGMELLKAERELRQAKAALASLWGGTESDFLIDGRDFDNISKVEISEEELIESLTSTPDFLALTSLQAQAESAYELEKANSIQGPTIGLGVRDFRESREQALVASFSLPLPVLDQNRGNIIKAQSQLAQVAYSNEAKLNELKVQILNSFRMLQLAEQQVSALKSKIIPAAENALKETRSGYDRGKFPYFEVIDAQRTLFEAKFSLNNELKDYHIRKAELERFLPKTNN